MRAVSVEAEHPGSGCTMCTCCLSENCTTLTVRTVRPVRDSPLQASVPHLWDYNIVLGGAVAMKNGKLLV